MREQRGMTESKNDLKERVEAWKRFMLEQDAPEPSKFEPIKDKYFDEDYISRKLGFKK